MVRRLPAETRQPRHGVGRERLAGPTAETGRRRARAATLAQADRRGGRFGTPGGPHSRPAGPARRVAGRLISAAVSAPPARASLRTHGYNRPAATGAQTRRVF